MKRPTTIFLGFGEAGQAFAEGLPAPFGAYDRMTDMADTAMAKRAEYRRLGAAAYTSAADAVAAAEIILSLVTADQALAAACEAAQYLRPQALFLDMNSVAPDTKRAAAKAIEAAGGRYVDVAVMAPVHPKRRAVPLLVCGPHAQAGLAALGGLGFTNVHFQPGDVGAAASIKMIRSVMVKGIEALTAECLLAATRAGVRDAVIASLDASATDDRWAVRGDYNLDRMMIHGLRRAEEMEEVVKTLDSLGTGSVMTRGTVIRQRAIGLLGGTAPDGLNAKIAAILNDRLEEAA
ncbi:3-hydroxyisobutyrate dehydrogenase-like beta-hydroxyacid dehydrogenase [Sphingomonas vulcanisoli]|uniref:3-hydroxyisobutyrate dehydrogenase-like beta-hydroxyacid dehydrogenase n=1 Tax=Sphingomonas vulcanisoli TaxID=1658060 RepID=A0ABX0TWY3_9SPHN|nr:NAD(P)-dependent oxidoreductase [Sphingomonas vulcanisoli]NIJ09209.1 3-hydroxyisobutyrate dehydrogenase-like beta-hydroxyacid dehydrogenase [Sphingomonas vulcanisoli]